MPAIGRNNHSDARQDLSSIPSFFFQFGIKYRLEWADGQLPRQLVERKINASTPSLGRPHRMPSDLYSNSYWVKRFSVQGKSNVFRICTRGPAMPIYVVVRFHFPFHFRSNVHHLLISIIISLSLLSLLLSLLSLLPLCAMYATPALLCRCAEYVRRSYIDPLEQTSDESSSMSSLCAINFDCIAMAAIGTTLRYALPSRSTASYQ